MSTTGMNVSSFPSFSHPTELKGGGEERERERSTGRADEDNCETTTKTQDDENCQRFVTTAAGTRRAKKSGINASLPPAKQRYYQGPTVTLHG